MSPDRLPDLDAFEPARLAEARRHLRSAVLWPARVAASYAGRQGSAEHEASVVPALTWQRERRAVVTPEFDNGLQLELRLPMLHMQFLERGQPVPHVLDLDDRSPAHVEAWLLVELLHRGIERERFSKKLPFDVADAMSGDQEKFDTMSYPAELAALTDWLSTGADVLDRLAQGAPVSVSAQTVSLTANMRLGTLGGERGDSRRVVFSLGDTGEREPYFAVMREPHGTVTPLRPDIVLPAGLIRRSAMDATAIAHRLEAGNSTLGAA